MRLYYSLLVLATILLAGMILPAQALAHGSVMSIHMYRNRYTPTAVTIYKGEKILFENSDNQPHWPQVSFAGSGKEATISASADSAILAKQLWLYKFDLAGTYRYQDKLNPKIQGDITVRVGSGLTTPNPEDNVKPPSRLGNFWLTIWQLLSHALPFVPKY